MDDGEEGRREGSKEITSSGSGGSRLIGPVESLYMYMERAGVHGSWAGLERSCCVVSSRSRAALAIYLSKLFFGTIDDLSPSPYCSCDTFVLVHVASCDDSVLA